MTQSVENLFSYSSPVEFLPFRAAFKAFLEPAVTHDEVPNQEIKIVASVVFCLHVLLLIKNVELHIQYRSECGQDRSYFRCGKRVSFPEAARGPLRGCR